MKLASAIESGVGHEYDNLVRVTSKAEARAYLPLCAK